MRSQSQTSRGFREDFCFTQMAICPLFPSHLLRNKLRDSLTLKDRVPSCSSVPAGGGLGVGREGSAREKGTRMHTTDSPVVQPEVTHHCKQ